MPLPRIDYPEAVLSSEMTMAVYELAVEGWSNDLCGHALMVQTSEIERELKSIRNTGCKIVRPPNTQATFMRAIGVAAVISRYEFHMINGKKFKTDAARMAAERKAIDDIAKSLGRSPMWVSAMIRLYREHVIEPARKEIFGGEKTVKQLVKAA